jgi:hypothetical protein
MRWAPGVLVVCVAACGGSDGASPGTERGPCRADGTCDDGLVCLSDLCVREDEELDGGTTVDAQAGDAGDPADLFTSVVRPILAARCDGCHADGTGGAPVFGASHADVIAYQNGGQRLVGCSPTESRLLTRGPHADGDAPVLDAGEAAMIIGYLDAVAAGDVTCLSPGRRPTTGPYALQLGTYTIDLSILGPGLGGASASFDVVQDGNGLAMSGFAVTAGTGGLTVLGTVVEVCPAGDPALLPALEGQRLDLAPGSSGGLGGGGVSLGAAQPGDTFAVRFEALAPRAGAQGSPLDSGGACSQ